MYAFCSGWGQTHGAQKGKKMKETVVTIGTPEAVNELIRHAAEGFGWEMVAIPSVDSSHTQDGWMPHATAVILYPPGLEVPLPQAIEAVQRANPATPILVCDSVTRRRDWIGSPDSGVFHFFPLPARMHDIQRSLGFVWAARMSPLGNVEPTPEYITFG